ncbi:MAG: hypothetical protein JWM90_2258 [Thermoleophilia bacterium]|nr:hypothetical protein [Thermoleophilia bacterium]
MCGTNQVAAANGGGYAKMPTQNAVGGAFGTPVQKSTTQVAAAAGGGHAHDAAAAGAGGHGAMPKVPPKTPAIQQTLVDGSYGPTVTKGKAETIKIPDGDGFGGIKGRKQNADDKKQNNYSVTDANFFPTMGVLKDASTGQPFSYVKQIQAYNAAGYISTFDPATYAKMVAAQDAGQGSILGMALNVMGVDGAPTDPGMAAAGLQTGAHANSTVPGTNLNAKQVVMSGKDATGEEWARPHHAESAWPMYKSLLDAGLDGATSMALAGDDAVSGAGRMNGFNNQDGKTGLNADERAVYQVAARIQQQTGIQAVGIMAGGHAHTGIDPSAKTKPNINKLIGLDKGDVSNSADRQQRIYQALLDGTVDGGDAKKANIEGKGAFKGLNTPPVLQAAVTAVAGAKGDGKPETKTGAPTQSYTMAGGAGGTTAMSMPGVSTGSTAPAEAGTASGGGMAGCSGMDDAKGSVGQLGGPTANGLPAGVAAALQQVVLALQALVTALQGITGGGGIPAQTAAPKPLVATPLGGTAPVAVTTAAAPAAAGGGQTAAAAAAAHAAVPHGH